MKNAKPLSHLLLIASIAAPAGLYHGCNYNTPQSTQSIPQGTTKIVAEGYQGNVHRVGETYHFNLQGLTLSDYEQIIGVKKGQTIIGLAINDPIVRCASGILSHQYAKRCTDQLLTDAETIMNRTIEKQ